MLIKRTYQPIRCVFTASKQLRSILKAYLIFAGIEFPSTHNLSHLVSLCKKKDTTFNEIIKKAESLTGFAVEICYPDNCVMPSIEETRKAYETAKEIKESVLRRIRFE